MELEQLREEIKKALSLNVNDKVEKKNDLTYLSWSWCFQETMKIDPQFSYKVLEDINGLPYWYDDNLGYIVKTEMTILGITRSMWLPVMNANNYAMKNEPYEVKTKFKTFNVDKASMMDINKTIMRCLVKNVAICIGLGLYIYAGEDLPESDEEKEAKQTQSRIAKNKALENQDKENIKPQTKASKNAEKQEIKDINEMELPFEIEKEEQAVEDLTELHDKIADLNFKLNRDTLKCYEWFCSQYGVAKAEDLSKQQLQEIITKLQTVVDMRKGMIENAKR